MLRHWVNTTRATIPSVTGHGEASKDAEVSEEDREEDAGALTKQTAVLEAHVKFVFSQRSRRRSMPGGEERAEIC